MFQILDIKKKYFSGDIFDQKVDHSKKNNGRLFNGKKLEKRNSPKKEKLKSKLNMDNFFKENLEKENEKNNNRSKRIKTEETEKNNIFFNDNFDLSFSFGNINIFSKGNSNQLKETKDCKTNVMEVKENNNNNILNDNDIKSYNFIPKPPKRGYLGKFIDKYPPKNFSLVYNTYSASNINKSLCKDIDLKLNFNSSPFKTRRKNIMEIYQKLLNYKNNSNKLAKKRYIRENFFTPSINKTLSNIKKFDLKNEERNLKSIKENFIGNFKNNKRSESLQKVFNVLHRFKSLNKQILKSRLHKSFSCLTINHKNTKNFIANNDSNLSVIENKENIKLKREKNKKGSNTIKKDKDIESKDRNKLNKEGYNNKTFKINDKSKTIFVRKIVREEKYYIDESGKEQIVGIKQSTCTNNKSSINDIETNYIRDVKNSRNDNIIRDTTTKNQKKIKKLLVRKKYNSSNAVKTNEKINKETIKSKNDSNNYQTSSFYEILKKGISPEIKKEKFEGNKKQNQNETTKIKEEKFCTTDISPFLNKNMKIFDTYNEYKQKGQYEIIKCEEFQKKSSPSSPKKYINIYNRHLFDRNRNKRNYSYHEIKNINISNQNKTSRLKAINLNSNDKINSFQESFIERINQNYKKNILNFYHQKEKENKLKKYSIKNSKGKVNRSNYSFYESKSISKKKNIIHPSFSSHRYQRYKDNIYFANSYFLPIIKL